ncbi:hypothetical protein PHLGIDRAFT_425143 [Phlebiopsis gigantea 11061_1 CR5-6]|uniref:DUF7918 domain-containing protein n=1 Tax=Phlebiopsis gigantea (strain 11061_1 CR5-6) TaxID=745531 RepID=A0A0C3PLE8_PHLG1|nr:hypothetical protein PHLGIDRAFT_425143 [Phlebiopsis gigantea 11061_1 CR5-6]
MLLGDFEISVQVADKPLAEYNVDQPTAREKSCYISSQAGMAFKIGYNNRSRSQAYRSELYLDGRMVSCRIIDPQRSDSILGMRVSETQRQPFVFAILQLVDDVHPNSSVDTEALGTIEARLYRTSYVGRRKPAKYEPRTFENIGSVNERSKKAGGHCVILGEAVQAPHATTSERSFKDIDSADRPYHTLRFRYRSEDILQAQGIIPLPKKVFHPTTSSRKRAAPDVEAEPTSSKNANNEVLDHRVSKKAKIKAELSDDSDVEVLQNQLDSMEDNIAEIRKKIGRKRAAKSAVKREHSPITLHAKGEVIDLTSD